MTGDDAAPNPRALTAVTVTAYNVPFVKAPTVVLASADGNKSDVEWLFAL